jgi:hypothetical protein
MKRVKKRAELIAFKKHLTIRGKNRFRNNLNICENNIKLAVDRKGFLIRDSSFDFALNYISTIRKHLKGK